MTTRPAIQKLLLATSLLLVFSLGFASYVSTGHDDSHITFWASLSLLESGEILNYNGARIEQSSTLLMTLATALLAWSSGLDVVTAGYLVAIFASLLSVYCVIKLAQTSKLPEASSALLVATSPAFLFWTFSGMETSLAALLLSLFIFCWHRCTEKISAKTLVTAFLATLALVSVRPEMPVVITCVVMAWLFTCLIAGKWQAWKRFNTVFLVASLLACGALFLFRWCYFESLFPAPVYAKSGTIDLSTLHQGFVYLVLAALANPLLLIAIPAALFTGFSALLKQEIDFARLASSFTLLAYSAFILLSGGDWMAMARFAVPVIPLAGLLAVTCMVSLANKAPLKLVIVALLVMIHFGLHAFIVQRISSGIPLWASIKNTGDAGQHYNLFEKRNQEHLRDIFVIHTLDKILDTHKKESDEKLVIASAQGGMVFFYSALRHKDHILFLDTHSLTDNTLINCLTNAQIRKGVHGLETDITQIPSILRNNPLCNTPEPDIIYDLNTFSQNLPQQFEKQGYTLWHQEKGIMLKRDSIYNKLFTPNVIMVKNALAETLYEAGLKPVTIDWNALPFE